MMFVLSVGALGLFSAGVTRVPSAHAVGAGPTANAPTTPRRAALALGARAAVGGILLPMVTPLPAAALVKGSAPPKTMKPRKDRPTCTSIDDCRAVGEAERDAIDATAEEDFKRTAGGDRYRDLAIGSGQAASRGDAVQLRYRVMRLGTRARDGLSGEGQTIFSLGFGEDEDKEGDTLVTPLDGQSLVAGINDAVIGMQTGGRRRVLVRPERGWKEQTAACADIVFRADIGAAVENETACLTKTKQPLPRSYGGKQRFARRFDESLLVELDLVGLADDRAIKATGQYYDRCEQNPFAEGCVAD